ncbi:hypothetical protein GCM10010287_43670 [Streptomyces variabilis]|uniref:ABC3 transporter permease C-terminal domain-containing protein n=1 Tax=Streptomyces variabilis TaxID=67372 RepID=A0ABQ2U2A7_9ACTN|nr:hypothetical protein GCM10010265_31000 [Streptomyces griseoincarnatus]GGT64391.1 hypothetical protein GCM10010287_43670 [Streptomyces variabilis]
MLARARAHPPLLAAALLTVLLTTAVLATLAAYSTTIGDASLRHALANPRDAAGTTLLVKAESLPEGGRTAADAAVRRAAERAYDGLPVTLRTLARSGPYGLPPSLRPADRRAGSEEPDLTHFAALDRTQVRLTEGRMPSARPAGPEIEVALPVVAARELGLRPGARITLDNRLKGPAARVLVTGLYRPADTSAPYWQLDELAGRGIVTVHFTTYGPLLTDPAVLAGGRVSAGPVGWLASADFSGTTTGRIDALRTAMKEGVAALPHAPALHGSATAAGDLPATLDRVERALFVSRSTLLVVVLQLALLAACALLLVARLLTAERAAETRLLRARGASRARVARLAALEALLPAVPAALCAPLLAGPLTRLLAGRGALARIGLHLDASVTSVASQGTVWLVSAGVALVCALAVTLPALATPYAPGRAKPLPGLVRAGGDLGLLAVAGVAYWQLSRRSAGAVGEDLGVDPLLVAAPALALLAGTVLTLRLLPLPARLAERRAARSRGLSGALAGWQLGRRPMRGAGPVLLLVLAVALGMLAVGQGSSWERSQDDQADFRAGTQVRVLSNGTEGPGRGAAYAAVPGVRSASPALRTTVSLSGGRQATVLALDTEGTAGTLLMRPDLADVPVRTVLSGLAPKGATAGVRVPAGTARLALTASLRGADAAAADVTATVEDAHGVPYPLTLGELPPDGRPHDLVADLEAVAGGPAGPLTLTGVHLDLPQPVGPPERSRLALTALTATDTAGRDRALPLSARWRPSLDGDGPDSADDTARPRMAAGVPATVDFTATPPPARHGLAAHGGPHARPARPAAAGARGRGRGDRPVPGVHRGPGRAAAERAARRRHRPGADRPRGTGAAHHPVGRGGRRRRRPAARPGLRQPRAPGRRGRGRAARRVVARHRAGRVLTGRGGAAAVARHRPVPGGGVRRDRGAAARRPVRRRPRQRLRRGGVRRGGPDGGRVRGEHGRLAAGAVRRVRGVPRPRRLPAPAGPGGARRARGAGGDGPRGGRGARRGAGPCGGSAGHADRRGHPPAARGAGGAAAAAGRGVAGRRGGRPARDHGRPGPAQGRRGVLAARPGR